jgi:hypothetical protein
VIVAILVYSVDILLTVLIIPGFELRALQDASSDGRLPNNNFVSKSTNTVQWSEDERIWNGKIPHAVTVESNGTEQRI